MRALWRLPPREFKSFYDPTTVAEKTFSGPIFNEIKEVFPNQEIIDRTTMNTWEDGRITDRVNKFSKTKNLYFAVYGQVCVSLGQRSRPLIKDLRFTLLPMPAEMCP